MESSSSNRARWSGNSDNNEGQPWSFGKAITCGSVAGFSGGGMPGTYPVSPDTSGSPRNFDPDDPGEGIWHNHSTRNSLRGTTVSRGSASAASDFVVDIENLKVDAGNNEADAFHTARTGFVQQPSPVYRNGIANIYSPTPTRPYHHSNTWSMSDFGQASEDLSRHSGNFSHSRSNALSGVFTLDVPQQALTRVNSAVSPHRVATPDIGIQLAAYAIADSILGYIFGAVKGFFSCIGSRRKDPRPEEPHDDQTHGIPVAEFIITIDEASVREGTISSETELDYATEMERIRNVQIGLADEEERPQSVLLPPCPVYVADQFTRPRSKSFTLPPSLLYDAEELRPRSRPISYPGAPDGEGIATVKQEITTEMYEELDTINDIHTGEDYSSSDIDDYHKVLRNGIGTEVGDYHETLRDIEAAQIRPGDYEVYTPIPKKLKRKGKERLSDFLSPIVDVASSVRTFLSSTISIGHEEDDIGFTSSEDASPSTPTLIRAAIGTSITNARRVAGLSRNGDGIAADADTPEDNPKLLALFGGKKPPEEYLRPRTPPYNKSNYEFLTKEIRFRRRQLDLKEETEESLYLFNNNMWGDESLGYEIYESEETTGEIVEEDSLHDGSEEEQLEEEEIPEEGVYEEHSTCGNSEIKDSDSVIVGDSMAQGDSDSIAEEENVHKADVDEYVKMHRDQQDFKQAFTTMFEDKMIFDAAHPDSGTPDGSECGPSDCSNDFDGCKVLGSPTSGSENNFDLSLVETPVVERRISAISTISTTSVVSKTEAIKVLRQELHHLGIGSSGDPLIDKLTWTSRHTSIVSVVERPDSFRNLVDLFGDEEESEDDSKKTKLTFGGNKPLFRRDQRANATNDYVPSEMGHVSYYLRAAEVKQGIVSETSANFRKESAARMSYAHLYDAEDLVASDEDEQEHEKEYKRYYEEQHRLQCG
ncbi:uncharacterized protein LAJ45_07300 [Morchella importuna]|uniref:uncharacterized protein n=1 Tax=Morchella importuna TaxID=1174673 RepID=UPI001E8DF2BD|nr:uncharacterized protein LAJ45_07300 [Morchella importuna]KAH8148589.1 hypothetical protein LAJ45_07300 [Morchella importuna]